jgi:hypothetical protein
MNSKVPSGMNSMLGERNEQNLDCANGHFNLAGVKAKLAERAAQGVLELGRMVRRTGFMAVAGCAMLLCSLAAMLTTMVSLRASSVELSGQVILHRTECECMVQCSNAVLCAPRDSMSLVLVYFWIYPAASDLSTRADANT